MTLPPAVYFVSLGCPKNLTDTEVLMGQFATNGYRITSDPSEAETIVVNTCAFLKSARQESRQVIKEMAGWKKRGRCKKLYIAGCLPKLTEDRPLPLVDGFLDSVALYDHASPRVKATAPWYAYVKIAEGCNNSCAYCLIPTIRGRLKTRPISDVLQEVRQLVARGVKEIIYVAQDTTAYPDFPFLLRQTARLKGVQWIRIMYAYPAHVTKKLIKVLAQEPKIVKYLDLPIQHASDPILRRMNRHYSQADLLALIGALRRAIPRLVLRTSVIVGFPGETAQDFAELLSFIKKVKFDKLGVFPFSREPGTAAFKLKGQVSAKTKEARRQKLLAAQKKISLELNKKLLGKKLEAIVEAPGKARSWRDAPEIDGRIFLTKKLSLPTGQLVKVQITRATAYDLFGRPVK